jgi:hypothetical protein
MRGSAAFTFEPPLFVSFAIHRGFAAGTVAALPVIAVIAVAAIASVVGHQKPPWFLFRDTDVPLFTRATSVPKSTGRGAAESAVIQGNVARVLLRSSVP